MPGVTNVFHPMAGPMAVLVIVMTLLGIFYVLPRAALGVFAVLCGILSWDRDVIWEGVELIFEPILSVLLVGAILLGIFWVAF